MEEEIKEIIECANKVVFNEVGMQLDTKQVKILLDYITNLQEENKRLKEDIEDISVSHFSLFKQYEDYKQRNEKAIEYIEEQSDYISSKSGTYYMCYAERNIVLDILKGDKDE